MGLCNINCHSANLSNTIVTASKKNNLKIKNGLNNSFFSVQYHMEGFGMANVLLWYHDVKEFRVNHAAAEQRIKSAICRSTAFRICPLVPQISNRSGTRCGLLSSASVYGVFWNTFLNTVIVNLFVDFCSCACECWRLERQEVKKK